MGWGLSHDPDSSVQPSRHQLEEEECQALFRRINMLISTLDGNDADITPQSEVPADERANGLLR